MVDGVGFTGDLDALTAAAAEVSVAVATWHGQGGVDVVDVTPSAGQVGHAGLGAACEEFAARWDRGINDRIDHVRGVEARLVLTAQQYAGSDELTAQILGRLNGDL